MRQTTRGALASPEMLRLASERSGGCRFGAWPSTTWPGPARAKSKAFPLACSSGNYVLHSARFPHGLPALTVSTAYVVHMPTAARHSDLTVSLSEEAHAPDGSQSG